MAHDELRDRLVLRFIAVRSERGVWFRLPIIKHVPKRACDSRNAFDYIAPSLPSIILRQNDVPSAEIICAIQPILDSFHRAIYNNHKYTNNRMGRSLRCSAHFVVVSLPIAFVYVSVEYFVGNMCEVWPEHQLYIYTQKRLFKKRIIS